MRLLAIKLALACVPILAMAGINYAVDPANLFHADVEQRIVTGLLRGQTVPYAGNYDERIVEQLYIRDTPGVADVVVLGSSRAMQMRARMFGGRTVFNHAVSGATLEDFIALVGAYQRRGQLPRSVVLECDPWLFNRHNGQTRWRSISNDYNFMSRRLGIGEGSFVAGWRSTASKYSQLISPDYLQESLRQIASSRRQTSVDADVQYLLPDGSVRYSAAFRARTTAEREADAERMASGKVYSLSGFDSLDRNTMQEFERLLEYLRQQNIRVSIVIVPYHPVVFKVLANEAEYRMVGAAEGYLRDAAASRGLAITGSYDPSRAGCAEGDFFDGMHPDEECVGRIVERLKPGIGF